MSASEGGQVNLNNPAQDKKFKANPGHDLRSQKSFSEHESVCTWVLLCVLVPQHIRLLSRDVCVPSCLVIMTMKYI